MFYSKTSTKLALNMFTLTLLSVNVSSYATDGSPSVIDLQVQKTGIDLLITRIGFMVQSKTIAVIDIKAVQRALIELRIAFNKTAPHVLVHHEIVSVFKKMLKNRGATLAHDLQKCTIDIQSAFEKTVTVSPAIVYAKIQGDFSFLGAELGCYGLSAMNQFARDMSTLAYEYDIQGKAARCLPYTLLATYAYVLQKINTPAARVAQPAAVEGLNTAAQVLENAAIDAVANRVNPAALVVAAAAARRAAVVAAVPVVAPAGNFSIGPVTLKHAVEWSPFAAVASTILKKDVEDLGALLFEQWKRTRAYLANETYDNPCSVRKSSFTFKMIEGQDGAKAALAPMVAYHTVYKEQCSQIGVAPDKGYLLEGALALTKDMAHAIAGEIGWRVYDIHASTLVSKKLGDILEEAEKYGPTVLVINELEWLYVHERVEPSVLSDLITRLASYTKSTSKKRVIVVATTKDRSKVDSALFDSTRLAVTIQVLPLTVEERAKILVRECADRALVFEQATVDQMIAATDGCDYGQLKKQVQEMLLRDTCKA